MITNQALRETFVSPNMQYYLHKKLAPISPADVDVRTEELLKFLNMSIYCGGDIPFSAEVDNVWHYWIMETAEYFKLCSKLHGKIYIHHSSNDFQEYNEKNNVTGEENLALSEEGIETEDTSAANDDTNAGTGDHKQDANLDRALSILVAYVLNYGPFEESRIQYWPMAKRVMERFDWNVARLNEWLQSLLEEDAKVIS